MRTTSFLMRPAFKTPGYLRSVFRERTPVLPTCCPRKWCLKSSTLPSSKSNLYQLILAEYRDSSCTTASPSQFGGPGTYNQGFRHTPDAFTPIKIEQKRSHTASLMLSRSTRAGTCRLQDDHPVTFRCHVPANSATVGAVVVNSGMNVIACPTHVRACATARVTSASAVKTMLQRRHQNVPGQLQPHCAALPGAGLTGLRRSAPTVNHVNQPKPGASLRQA